MELATYAGFLNAIIECLHHIDENDVIKEIIKDYVDQLTRVCKNIAAANSVVKVKQDAIDTAYELHLKVVQEYIASIKKRQELLDIMPKIIRATEIASKLIVLKGKRMQNLSGDEVSEQLMRDDMFNGASSELIHTIGNFVLAPIVKLEQKQRTSSMKDAFKILSKLDLSDE